MPLLGKMKVLMSQEQQKVKRGTITNYRSNYENEASLELKCKLVRKQNLVYKRQIGAHKYTPLALHFKAKE